MAALFFLFPLLAIPTASGADSVEARFIAKPEAIRTLVNPNCSHCRDEAKRRGAELRNDDRILCWIRGYSDGGAIPMRFFLNPYRVVSDSYGVFVYDPDAGYARGFAPSYQFRFHGWRNGIMVMRHEDGTLYSCLSGIAFAGPRKGTRLEVLPTLVSDWGFWLERYPQAVAYHMFDKYKPVELPTELNEDSRRSRAPADGRLPANALVLGITLGDHQRAYPVAEIEKVGFIEDQLGGPECVVLWNGPTRTAAAYLPLAVPPRKYSAPHPDANGESPKSLEEDSPRRRATLVRDDRVKTAPFTDKETNSRWDIAGRCVAGSMKGWTLVWLDSTQVKWFAWAAEYPQTTLFQK